MLHGYDVYAIRSDLDRLREQDWEWSLWENPPEAEWIGDSRLPAYAAAKEELELKAAPPGFWIGERPVEGFAEVYPARKPST